ncbi:hypothetical protein [Verminephrobacter aporrectodeae]|uniref:hypothetical protein n=2 Tax=Verminephrobacter aporrectodeae TaxID=1110389 RepID=UPI001110779E|nr:hypothetical protein [Verminephrobacter aporrectodeae]
MYQPIRLEKLNTMSTSTLRHLLVIIVCIFLSKTSFALGRLSRACFISELRDLKIEKEALLFFKYLGMPDRFYELKNKSRGEQARHAIFESITTDYGNAKYYLFAESRVYKRFTHPRSGKTEYRKYKHYTSSFWDIKYLDPEILQDSRLSIFNHNRKVATSVRAGNPDFVEAVDYRWDELQGNMIVIGVHAYYDPSTRLTSYLNRSEATDCNLSNWGLQDR